MKFPAAAAVLVLAGSVIAVSPRALAQTSADIVHTAAGDEIVVDLEDSASDADVAAIARAAGVTLLPNSFMAREDRVMRAIVPAGTAASVAARIRSMAHVTGADANFRVRASFMPNDPQLEQQWHMTRVGAPTAWNYSCGRGVTVAVVDTGVACENRGEFTRVLDLAGTRCLPGFDFVLDSEHASDQQGHGTHVAGTIAQTTNNGFGVAGLAYCATILPVRVLDQDGYGSLADVAEGIRYAADHGAQVINLSLGGGFRSRVMEDAVVYARAHGAVVVCAAGNNGRYVESPANAPGSFAVSATDPGDALAYFSSRGPEVDIAAPGVNVTQHTICNHGRDRCEQFAAWSGTSMAAPHVAGIAAMIYALGVNNPDAVERVLRDSASHSSTGSTDREHYGAGIVDAAAAVRMAVTRLAWARGLALLAGLAFIVFMVRRAKGALAPVYAWLPTAVFTGLGLFFLPWFVPRVVPGVDLAMRPLGDWTMLLGMSVHRWLPLANAAIVLLFVAVGFSRPKWRAPIGGLALGTFAYVVGGWFTGFLAAPMGRWLLPLWILANAVACLWVARIALDRETAK